MRRQYRSRSSLCIATGLLSAVLLSTASTNIGNAHAETVDYNVNIEPSLVVTIPSNTVELNINPVTAQFNSANLSVTVGTNNATGYTLTMSSDSTDLSKAGSADTIPTLETLAGGYPEADFTVNHWGYKLSTATNYLPFTTSNELDVTNAPTNSKTSIVNFAAKADLSKPAGTYKLAIDFAAVANHVPVTWEMAYTNAGKTKTEGYYSIQDATSAMCTEVDMGETITVRDTRDGETYLIGKLADNRCWLLDNLRLDLTNETVIQALNDTNTNATAESLGYLKNGGGTFLDQWAIAGLAKTNWTDQFTYSQPQVAKSGTCYNTNCVNNPTEGTWNKDATTTKYGNSSGKIGIYYNYCAASAGSYCWGDETDSSGSPTTDPIATSAYDIAGDICPKGWRMPTNGTIDTTVTPNGGEYSILNNAYPEDQDDLRNAFSVALSGLLNMNTARNQGTTAYFWSSTWISVSAMRNLLVSTSNISPSNSTDRAMGGLPVRCILKY